MKQCDHIEIEYELFEECFGLKMLELNGLATVEIDLKELELR
jgi:hypothetical protein